jgi:hypothetical protein
MSGEWRSLLNVRNKRVAGVFLFFSEETNKTEQKFTGVTLWGVFRA